MRIVRHISLPLLCLGLVACFGGPPKDPYERSATEIYVQKGVQYMEAGRLDIAQRDLQHAVELDDSNFEAHNALGVLHERMGRPAEAEEQFKRALSLSANNPDAAVNYGRVLCAQGKFDQAMKHFQMAVDSKTYTTSWLAFTNAGICLRKQGQVAESEGYLRKALEANPNFAPALLEMVRLSLDNGNPLSARAFLQRFEAAVPEPSAASLLLGVQIEQAMGNPKDANAYLKKLQRLFPDSKEAMSYRSHRSTH
jgi:type IV pilus assembly protein PilF